VTSSYYFKIYLTSTKNKKTKQKTTKPHKGSALSAVASVKKVISTSSLEVLVIKEKI